MEDRFKFRVWDYDKKQMVYYSSLFGCKRPFTERSTFVQYESCPHFHKISEPMLCTGLKDKHGNLIYEGDIVRYDDGQYIGVIEGKIVYYKHSWCLCSKSKFMGVKYIPIGNDDFFGVKSEIIGNIHIKGKDNANTI